MNRPPSFWTLPDRLEWTPAPGSLPGGCRYTILEGDPKLPGFFTARFRLPAGTRLAPHWHPREERATILSGRLRLGLGREINEAAMTSLGPQSFLLVPAGEPHYAIFDEATEIQLNGSGPWEVIYADSSSRR